MKHRLPSPHRGVDHIQIQRKLRDQRRRVRYVEVSARTWRHSRGQLYLLVSSVLRYDNSGRSGSRHGRNHEIRSRASVSKVVLCLKLPHQQVCIRGTTLSDGLQRILQTTRPRSDHTFEVAGSDDQSVLDRKNRRDGVSIFIERLLDVEGPQC